MEHHDYIYSAERSIHCYNQFGEEIGLINNDEVMHALMTW